MFCDAAAVFAADSTASVEVRALRFVGNKVYSDDDLRGLILTKDSPGRLNNFFYDISWGRLGAPPEYYDSAIFEADAARLESFYRDRGFFSCHIKTQAVIDSPNQKGDLSFLIDEGVRSYIDSLVYLGLDELPPDVYQQAMKNRLIKPHDPFDKALVDGEAPRIIGFLANFGYPLARLDLEHSSAVRRLSTNNFILTYSIIPGKRYLFGNTTIHVEPYRPDIQDYLITRFLEYSPGDIYSREKEVQSERNLNRIDLFESVILTHARPPDSTGSVETPMDISIHARDRYQLSPEVSISDENNAFNLGLGVGFVQRNFFGDARSFNVSAISRLQSLSNWNFHQVFRGRGLKDSSVAGALELQFEILQPYLFSKTLSGTETATISDEKQQPYILSILRNKVSVNDRLAPHTLGVLDWSLERVSPELLTSDSSAITDLEEEDQPQFNSILTLTLQHDLTNDIFSPSDGSFTSMTLEESGLLPRAIIGKLPFTQYLKLVLLDRWYYDLSDSRFDILAFKLKGGIQEKYGDSRYSDIDIPINHRFFAGGSGSIRAWGAHELGAMADPTLTQFGGDFVFEGSIESRINHFRGDGKFLGLNLNNVWGAYFIDYGNVWSGVSDFKAREIAIGAGMGIRYETLFGPFRLDYGIKVFDPREIPARQWIFDRKFMTESLPNGAVQFGIGQAF